MKYLKLDARHPECHGLAKALVGSPVVVDRLWYKEPFLCGVSIDHENNLFAVDGRDGYFYSVGSINIPIDSLKLCPYVAMREGLVIACVRVVGFIDEINSKTLCKIQTSDGVSNRMPMAKIKLDLSDLPKGAEIVEAE